MVADLIAVSAKELKFNVSESMLFAYGGNGSLFACGVAERAGIDKVQLFALGPVFSAFGSSVSGICHVYERRLGSIAASRMDGEAMRKILQEIKAEAVKDLLGEGIRPDGLTYEIEIEASKDSRKSIPVPCPESVVANPEGLRAALASALGGSAGGDSEKIVAELMRVRVKKAMSKAHLERRALQRAESSNARTGSRKILSGSGGGEAQLYKWESLEPGNRVEGPAVLEGSNTTYLVPDGWTLTVDEFGNAGLSRK
jgi:N-methylhydantoinase A/oxoprolinase/acetone carboxylase beta subunit